ncbi:zinc-binding dehydrogenase [Streptomyces sp. N2-109]|uniref:Zinc-binding dehydrogenase n=1 Tax=Streptomyces gossypii TaxID=2883101 RepID=A0ABT2JYH8_9ACTN|nr:zinc-binding dehydrogenase [Streptomyces gossypii]MCT2592781.1 zinc-binding dehydrogenase [Streptomyces gossypii]
MRAIRLHAFGPAENLVHEEVEDPEPGSGQVRVVVAAAGVHLIDTALREGLQLGPLPLPELPTIPGREIAGTVDAVGEGVDSDWLGRRVVAHLGQAPGGYAELAVVGTEALHVLPDGLDAPQAVAMIGTGRTVMGVLRGVELGPQDTVLVLAAAGGMGSLLLQYAKDRGARVVGAAGGPGKTETVAKLGADLAVDYNLPDWSGHILAGLSEATGQGGPGSRGGPDGDRPFTHVFDSVGGEPGRIALGLVAVGGTHHAYGSAATGFAADGAVAPAEEELAERGISVRSLDGARMLAQKRALEEESMAHAAAGTLVPLVQPFALAEAARAQRALSERGTIGKVVLLP